MLIQICFLLLLPLFIIILLFKLHQLFQWTWFERVLLKVDDVLKWRRRSRKPVLETILFLIVVFGFLAVSKTVKRLPPQIETRIAVLADSVDWSDLEGVLTYTYERIVRTPQPEKIYHLQHLSHDEMFRLPHYRYIVITASLETVGKVGTWVFGNLLSDSNVQKPIDDKAEYRFIRKTLWNKDQLIVVLAGRDRSYLKERIRLDKNRLFEIFEEDAQVCWRDALYSSQREQKVSHHLRKSYGWWIERQAALRIDTEIPDNGFVSFGTLTPNRWLFVRWIEESNKNLLTSEWVIRERDRLGMDYYNGMVTDHHYLESSCGSFLDRPAVITTGLWVDDDIFIGGPFKNYTFYDSASRRIYMIDFAAFDPGKMKIHHMREMDAVAHTFLTEIPEGSIRLDQE